MVIQPKVSYSLGKNGFPHLYSELSGRSVQSKPCEWMNFSWWRQAPWGQGPTWNFLTSLRAMCVISGKKLMFNGCVVKSTDIYIAWRKNFSGIPEHSDDFE